MVPRYASLKRRPVRHLPGLTAIFLSMEAESFPFGSLDGLENKFNLNAWLLPHSALPNHHPIIWPLSPMPHIRGQMQLMAGFTAAQPRQTQQSQTRPGTCNPLLTASGRGSAN